MARAGMRGALRECEACGLRFEGATALGKHLVQEHGGPACMA